MRREEVQVFTPLTEETYLIDGFHGNESGGYQGATTSTNTIVQGEGSRHQVSVLSDDGVIDDVPPESFEVEDFGSNVERRMVN